MIRSHGINRYDIWTVRHGDVSDPLLHLRIGCDANEEEEFRTCGAQPENGDETGEQDGAGRVDEPF